MSYVLAMRNRAVAAALLLAALPLVACSSDNGEAGYDAGTLPETGTGGGDDAPALPQADAGSDATIGTGADSGSGGPDTGVPAPNAADASDSIAPADAADSAASAPEAGSDGGSPADASDSSAPDATPDTSAPGDDASDAFAPDGDDGGSPDAADASAPADAGDAGVDATIDASLDATAAPPASDAATCVGFNLGGDAITGIAAATAPDNQTLDLSTTDPSQNQIPAADTVVVTNTTSPPGVMLDMAIGYFTSTDSTAQYVPMTYVTAAAGQDSWQGSLPVMAAGTQVSFWVVGHDVCKSEAGAGADYYSNSGNNYHYETK